jgi:bifunctional UDP-N-acetylglucosamine pyrophosphorylase/glucosamine-1-phosphate N-acetyltransferase
MCGDNPLLTMETMKRLVAEHDETGAVLSLATLHTDNPAFYNFGRIIRDENGHVAAIREYKDATEEEREIKEVNPGLYCFSDKWLWNALDKLNRANAQGEYYITDLLAIAIEEGQEVASVEMETWQETLGINTPEQLAEVEKWI